MYTPSVDSDSALFFEMYAYLLARLKADRPTNRLAAPIRAASKQLEKAEAHREATHQAMITALALRDAADGEADDLLRRFYKRMEEVTGKSNGGPLGRKYFPEGLHWLINTPIFHQPAEMLVLNSKLESEEHDELRAFSPMIYETANTLDAYNQKYQGAIEQAEAAYGVVLRSRGAWIRIYDKIFVELCAAKGKREAEDYFLKPNRKRQPTIRLRKR